MKLEEYKFIFNTSPPPQDLQRFTIISVGHVFFRPTIVCRMPKGWTHEHLLYTLDGAAIGHIAGQRSQALPGSLWITPKDQPYEFEADPKVGHWEACWIEFDGKWVRLLWEMLGLKGVTHVPNCIGIEPTVQEILKNFQTRGNAGLHEAVADLWRLFTIVERVRAQSVHNKAQQAIDRAQRHAREHLEEPLSLRHLAEAARLSPFHFARLFRQKTGLTPAAYVRTLRIAKAQELLRQGELNISEIAYAVGFPTVQHFSMLFKKSTGLTAREFQRSMARKSPHLKPRISKQSKSR